MGASAVASFTQEDIRTMQDRQKELIVQEGNQSYLYSAFKKGAQIVQCYDNVEVPLYLGSGTEGRWLGRGDRLPEGGERQLAMSVWNNRYLVVPTSEDIMDSFENEGNPSALFKLKDLAQWEAKLAWHRAMDYAIFHGGGGRQPDGLHSFLEKAAPSAQTAVFGGINKATHGTWWYNQYVQLTQNFGSIGPGTNQTAGEIAFGQLIDQCTVGTKMPSEILTSKAVWQNFKRLFRERHNPGHMVMKRQDGVDVGMLGFQVEGCTINWDPNVLADTILALHFSANKFEKERLSDGQTAKYYGDMEAVSVKSPLTLDGNMFAIINPNVRQRHIAPRSPYRQMSQTEWIVDSFNMGVGRLSDNGVAGSDNGSRWSTW